ncbi:MAG: hypothetical protein V5A84_00705 [Planctomycetota bacterium]
MHRRGAAAFVAASRFTLPSGPGAEGRVGDIILQNGRVRFVVAGPGHAPGPAATGGHLLDAVTSGGPDRMRLLLTRLGEPRTGQAVYRNIRITSRGDSGAAEAAAKGFCAGRPSLKLRTTYRLEPDARRLRITTKVTNRSEKCLRHLPASDALYPGRAVRYVESSGLFPAGTSGTADWLSFFDGRHAWGLFRPDARPMQAAHEVGVSRLTHRELSLPPGGTATFSRCLMAAEGDPSDVRRAALGDLLEHNGRLRVRVGDTKNPVKGAWVRLFLDGSLPTGLLRTGPNGKATCLLPRTLYGADYMADGHSRLPSTAPVDFREGNEVTITLPASPLPRATVRAPEGAGPARLLHAVRPRMPSDAPRAPFFSPVSRPGDLLAAGSQREVPAMPADGSRGTALVASRGPLHECAVVPSRALRNREKPLSIELERAVDPGNYVAVDFGQYSGASPRCALKAEERLLSNRCEGLHGALINLAPGVAPDQKLAAADNPAALHAVEFRAAGSGQFTVLPLQNDYQALSRQFPATRGGTRPAHRTLAALRREFPVALVQAAPARADTGDSEKGDWPRDRALSRGVDALQLLSGRDVPEARERLQRWFSMLNDGRRIFITGGSGSRDPLRTPAGLARTYVYCTADARHPAPERLKRAIGRLRDVPNAFVSNGPFIRATVNDRPIGSLQTTENALTVRLTVSAPRWVDLSTVTIYRNGREARRFDVGSASGVTRLEKTVELEPDGDCWLVIAASGDSGMRPVYPGSGEQAVLPFAVTNPFWIDGDGDGAVGRIR